MSGCGTRAHLAEKLLPVAFGTSGLCIGALAHPIGCYTSEWALGFVGVA